jgi:hypothetical protein
MMRSTTNSGNGMNFLLEVNKAEIAFYLRSRKRIEKLKGNAIRNCKKF